MRFAAVHMSAIGTSRHFVAAHQFGSNQTEADIERRDGRPLHAYEPTREAAMEAFAKSWRRNNGLSRKAGLSCAPRCRREVPSGDINVQVMMNAMVCHITEGELRLVQDGKPFTAKKDFVWTCNKGTIEHAANEGSVVAIMRITDLKA